MKQKAKKLFELLLNKEFISKPIQQKLRLRNIIFIIFYTNVDLMYNPFTSRVYDKHRYMVCRD